jgi:multicomponent K+:H+ antiporter subunit F
METILDIVIRVVLALHLLMILVAAWRTWRSENSISRLVGLDVASTLTTAIFVIVGIIRDSSLFLDVAIVTTALGYLSTVVIAKYISDQKVF